MSNSMTTTPNYKTGEFHPSDSGHAKYGGTAVEFGGKMYYTVPHPSKTLYISECNLSELQAADSDPGSVKDGDNWSTYDLDGKIKNDNNANFECGQRPQSVVLGAYMYIIWMDTHNNQVYAVRKDINGNWSNAPVKIQNSDGNNMGNVTGQLTAMTHGDKIVLNWINSGRDKFKGLVLLPEDFNTQSDTWQGTETSYSDISNVGLDSDYLGLAVTWFSQGVVSQNDATDPDPVAYNWIIAACYSIDDRKIRTFVVSLDAMLDLDDITSIGNTKFHSQSDVAKGVNLVRDPAGRIMLLNATHDVSGQDDNTLNYFLLDTNQNFSSGEPSWGSRVIFNDDVNLSKHTTKKDVTGIFLTGGQSTGNFADPSGNYTCTDLAMYLMVLYAKDDKSGSNSYHIQCQMGTYGTAKEVPDYFKASPTNTQIASIYAVMDSFPFPTQNIGNASDQSTMVNLNYGVNEQGSTRSSQADDFMFGIKSSLTTTKAVGPATETEIKAGTGSYFEAEVVTKRGTNYGVNTVVIQDPQGQPGELKILKYGELHGYPQYSIIEDVFAFADLSGTIVNNTDSPLSCQIRLDYSDDHHSVRSEQFEAYHYEPGNIYSYQVSEINTTMKNLYNGLTASQQAEFGEWGPQYAAGNYVDGVIKPNAHVLSESNNGRTYLDFSVDGNGGSTSEFETISSLYSESKTNLAITDYIGVSGGEEFNVFGVGVGFTVSLMGGFEANTTTASGTGSQSSWGTKATFTTPQGVPNALGYTANLGILKPSSLWALELKYFCPNADYIVNQRHFSLEFSQPLRTFWYVEDIHPVLPPAK